MGRKYCFRSDDDGHNYLIPADMSDLFDYSLDGGEEDCYEEFNRVFSEYGIDGIECYSFENPIGENDG